jgi:hypothetical protein
MMTVRIKKKFISSTISTLKLNKIGSVITDEVMGGRSDKPVFIDIKSGTAIFEGEYIPGEQWRFCISPE